MTSYFEPNGGPVQVRMGVHGVSELGVILAPVRMLAPVNVVASEVNDRDVRLDWQWKPQKYKTLDMLCQVQLEHSGHREMVSLGKRSREDLNIMGFSEPKTPCTLVSRGVGFIILCCPSHLLKMANLLPPL